MFNENFCSDKKCGHFLALFWSLIRPFSLKNQFFEHFLRNRISDLSKTRSETGDKWFESSNGSVLFEKILVLAVLAIFGSKTHCMWWHLYGFGLFLVIFFQTVDVFGLSALAEGPMDSRSCVRASVRSFVTRYLEIRTSDFFETWHKVASWRD